MKHHIRAFSLGLFTSALIILIVFYLVQDSQTPIEDVKAEELIPVLEDQGYAVLSQEEYISYSVNGNDSEKNTDTNSESTDEDAEQNKEETENNNKEEEETTEEDSSNEEESEEDSPKEYKLTIETGMASSQISDILENEDIIESASDFNDYLEDNDYAINVKPGTFELTSDMSHFEIAEVITSYN
ncbi:endolytic transglycosylase MltG [Oceanobacillus kimchii]|uniref:hypothetical protein n=1 Tax=Oceanobacillus kimchii TaxID=746691 RepID=UPI00034C5CD9|nr:hypothetical protein [Oceanobacillus kimchii]MCT1575898.1 endolytic transglycosylase MltG [Oceanobacillus kimchii]MCT2135535.1 endolytic transglycosylase MltG [Oceanobacillus kimchii]